MPFLPKFSPPILGDVFRGIWQGSPVALKRIKVETQSEELQREAELLSHLSHPNIVQVSSTR